MVLKGTGTIVALLLLDNLIFAYTQDKLPHKARTTTPACVLTLAHDALPAQSYTLCNKVLKLDQKVCDLEQKTLTILDESSTTNLKGLLGASGTGTLAAYILYWTHNNVIPNRFPGGGLLGLSMVAPLLKSAGILIVGTYVWRTFKRWIVEPYRLRHQEEIEKFKTSLTEHKKEILQTQQSFTQIIEQSLHHIRSTIDEELKTVRHEHKNIEQKQSTLHEHVQSVESRLQGDLGRLQKDIQRAHTITTEVKKGIETVLPQIAQMYTLVHQINQQTQDELKRINTLLDDKKKNETITKQRTFKFFSAKKN